jgi:hypothetical protein
MDEEIITKQNWAIAYHEAGHVLGFRLAGTKIKTATILPSRHYEGHVQGEWTRLEESVVCDCLGHAAELEFGVYNGWGGHSSDYQHAEERLKDPIRWARSKAWALAHNYIHTENRFPYEWEGKTEYRYTKGEVMSLFNRSDFRLYADYRDWRKATRIAKAEWKPAFDKAVRKARHLANKHHAYIQQVAELLMQHDTLTDDQIPQLRGGYESSHLQIHELQRLGK